MPELLELGPDEAVDEVRARQARRRRSAGTSPGSGIVTSQLANSPRNRAEIVASPGIGPALTRPSASTGDDGRLARLERGQVGHVLGRAVGVMGRDHERELLAAVGHASARPARRRSAPGPGRRPGVRGMPAAIQRQERLVERARPARAAGRRRGGPRPSPSGAAGSARGPAGRPAGRGPRGRSRRGRSRGRSPGARAGTRSAPAPCRGRPRRCSRPASGSARCPARTSRGAARRVPTTRNVACACRSPELGDDHALAIAPARGRPRPGSTATTSGVSDRQADLARQVTGRPSTVPVAINCCRADAPRRIAEVGERTSRARWRGHRFPRWPWP